MERLAFTVTLRLLPESENGRRGPIGRDVYHPLFDLGGRLPLEERLSGAGVRLLGGESLEPGAECTAVLMPIYLEHWDVIQPGAILPVHEGLKLVGHATVLDVNWTQEFARVVAAFVRAARSYCSFVARAPLIPLGERLRLTRDHLLSLYAAGSALPPVEPSSDTRQSPDFPAPAEWVGFAQFEYYWEVFDAYDPEDTNGLAGSLSDDILDVYRDIRSGFWHWDKGQIADAIWEWRFSFAHHWGRHAAGALLALHQACAQAKPAELA